MPQPLPSLLSHALIAFIIEFDNEIEHLVPHRTSTHLSTHGAPWLVSMVLWQRWLRFIPGEGITVAALREQTGASGKDMRQWLTRFSKWWSYATLHPAASGKPADTLIQPTVGGAKAIAAWRPLTHTIEQRWQARFGKPAIDQLRNALRALADQLDPAIPGALPILGYELLSHSTPLPQPAEHTLPALLSKTLLAFAVEFEQATSQPLAVYANTLRLIPDKGVRLHDLPRLSGVSKEAIAFCRRRLEELGLATTGPETPVSRTRVLRLTPEGRNAQSLCQQHLHTIEAAWQQRYHLEPLRKALEALSLARLLEGLKPYPDNWRATRPPITILPDYPMILHRGAFPDGS